MRAKIIKVVEKDSRYGGCFYYIFFKGEDGKNYKSCVYPQCGNYKRWAEIIQRYLKEPAEIWLRGLVLKGEKLIDADSLFEVEDTAYVL